MKGPYPRDKNNTYIHDPRKNRIAMADILVDPEAVYGFSPDPRSPRLGAYADYDWTDPEVVAKNRAERVAYLADYDALREYSDQLRAAGSSVEAIARAVVLRRNELRLTSYAEDPVGLVKAKRSNLITYGNETGPSPEFLLARAGSWENVLRQSFGSNCGMDACMGLYDERYELNKQSGLIDEETALL